MPIPVWVLLGFAAWTLLILFATVEVYRWSRILTGRTAIASWRRRATRQRVVPQGHPGPHKLPRESSDLHGNRRVSTCRARHQSNP